MLMVWWSCLGQGADSTWPVTLLSAPLPIFPFCWGPSVLMGNLRHRSTGLVWVPGGGTQESVLH